MNLNWPKTPTNNMMPWYVVIARVPGFAVMLVGRAVFAAGVWMVTLSWSEAVDSFNHGDFC